jgi:hypothetical protein
LAVEARSSSQFQRYASGRPAGSRGAWGNPSSKIEKGNCKIILDCPKGKAIINGENAGGIVCGFQTATGSKWDQTKHIGTIPMSTQGAGGAVLPAGYPMMNTKPSLCGDCFIHQYPWVESQKSLGCAGVEPKVWVALSKCGGSSFAIIPRKSSLAQAEKIAANYNALNGVSSPVAVAAPDLQATGGKVVGPPKAKSGFSSGFLTEDLPESNR